MKKNKYHSLLSSLQYIYRKISIVVVRIRIHSYRKLVESNSSFDITSVLNEQINTLAASSVKNNKIHDDVNEKPQHSELTFNKEDIKKYQSSKIENVSGVESEFAKHLKQKKSSSMIHPYLGDKLKQSAWEHIHCTIRYARQGNVVTARLHADIAGQALEEVAHYMKDEEYSELVFQIEECFIKSKKENGQEV